MKRLLPLRPPPNATIARAHPLLQPRPVPPAQHPPALPARLLDNHRAGLSLPGPAAPGQVPVPD